MDTPIFDFVQSYGSSPVSRLHMPGHKGDGPLGFERLDLTEIQGADALYEADGIIARSEQNAAALFGTGQTLYSTEGSSQCIRAMLYLAALCRGSRANRILAARNVHRAFVYGAGLVGLEVQWLLTEEKSPTLCRCLVTPEGLAAELEAMERPPAAVYLTSPDYLGNMADLSGLARVCHDHGTLLLVDNAHGAYLRFLEPSLHPMDLGADLCCDSAHKTMAVLTGGAYLHLAKGLDPAFCSHAKAAMAMFGSTSPSYLTLASLDLNNRTLSGQYREQLRAAVQKVARLREKLTAAGWQTVDSDPLKLTIHCAARGVDGRQAAEQLRRFRVECEFADPDYLVLMFTERNLPRDYSRVEAALLRQMPVCADVPVPPPVLVPDPVLDIRSGLFAPQEDIPVEAAVGRICGAPTVGCPPAVPVVVSGERITQEAVAWMQRYGLERVRVLSDGQGPRKKVE